MNEAQPTRGLILGAVFDFAIHCMNRENPMVVGGGYPRDAVIEEFEAWAAKRKITIDKIGIDVFKNLADSGLLQ